MTEAAAASYEHFLKILPKTTMVSQAAWPVKYKDRVQRIAFVVWWDLATIAVLCPMCARLEVQKFEPKDSTSRVWHTKTLIALCRPEHINYTIIFPWKVPHLAYEKNLEKARFETIGLDLPNLWEQQFDDRNPMQLKFMDSQQINLGDLRLLQSCRTSTGIQIMAPSATINGISVSQPLATMNGYTHKPRTVAVLDRRPPFQPLIAISGYNNSFSGSRFLVNNEKWTNDVFRIAEYITHPLDDYGFERAGREGQGYACHAEKQLMVCFIRKHCFLDSKFEHPETEMLKTCQTSQGGLKEAWIATDNPPCKDCRSFQQKLEAVCHIKFHFVEMREDFRGGKKTTDLQPPTTPMKPISKESQLLTPPDSGMLLLKKGLQPVREEEDSELGSLNKLGDPQSPTYGKQLCPIANLRTPEDENLLMDSSPILRGRKQRKLIRASPGKQQHKTSLISAPVSFKTRTHHQREDEDYEEDESTAFGDPQSPSFKRTTRPVIRNGHVTPPDSQTHSPLDLHFLANKSIAPKQKRTRSGPGADVKAEEEDRELVRPSTSRSTTCISKITTMTSLTTCLEHSHSRHHELNLINPANPHFDSSSYSLPHPIPSTARNALTPEREHPTTGWHGHEKNGCHHLRARARAQTQQRLGISSGVRAGGAFIDLTTSSDDDEAEKARRHSADSAQPPPSPLIRTARTHTHPDCPGLPASNRTRSKEVAVIDLTDD